MTWLHGSHRWVRLWAAVAVAAVIVLSGCSSTREIRVQNSSSRDFTNVSIGGRSYGYIAAGETSDYQQVELKFRYTSLELRADGRYLTGQTLNFGARRFTYRIDVLDYEKRHLTIEIIRE